MTQNNEEYFTTLQRLFALTSHNAINGYKKRLAETLSEIIFDYKDKEDLISVGYLMALRDIEKYLEKSI